MVWHVSHESSVDPDLPAHQDLHCVLWDSSFLTNYVNSADLDQTALITLQRCADLPGSTLITQWEVNPIANGING
jgi:hypothetical protein